MSVPDEPNPWLRSYQKLIPSLRPIMRYVTLTRTETGDDGTFGIIKTDSGFSVYSIELPWRGNASGKSCIPAGVYVCKMAISPKHGQCYYVTDVPGGRTDIEIHSANWAGDESKGYKCQLLGCIAPGRAIGELVGQKAVLSSKDALCGFELDLDKEPFQLSVQWGPGLEQTETGSLP